MLKKIFILAITVLWVCPSVYAKEQFPFLAKTTTNDVNVRAGQSKSFERITQLKKGQTVTVVDHEFSWYKIQLPPDAHCFVSADFIKIRVDDIGQVSANRLNIRAGSGRKHAIIGQLRKGKLVRIKKKEGDWYLIEPTDQAYGWVYENLLVFVSSNVPPPKTVTLPTRNVYRQPKLPAPPKPKVTKPKKRTPPVPKPEKGFVSQIGYIEDLGRVVQEPNVHYKLVVDGKTAYYLKCPRQVIDSFVHYKARIQGKIREDLEGQYPYPIVTVSRINLVL